MAIAESDLIRRIRQRAGNKRDKRLIAGIGDDCAVLAPAAGEQFLVSTDFSIEGVHFRRDWHPAESVGHRCLARGLSDIAAMAGEARFCFLSLALPRKAKQSWLDLFLDGFLGLAKAHDVTLAGGDIAGNESGIFADVVVIGSVQNGKARLRSTARPGDAIFVTGSLGASARTLADLRKGGIRKLSSRDHSRHYFPQPRIAVAQALAATGAVTSMIDISDGLSTDLAHLCAESKCGAFVNQWMLPLAAGATMAQALHGGEDYELLFTANQASKIPIEVDGVTVTEIGWMEKARGMRIGDLRSKPRKLAAKGFQHLK